MRRTDEKIVVSVCVVSFIVLLPIGVLGRTKSRQ